MNIGVQTRDGVVNSPEVVEAIEREHLNPPETPSKRQRVKESFTSIKIQTKRLVNDLGEDNNVDGEEDAFVDVAVNPELARSKASRRGSQSSSDKFRNVADTLKAAGRSAGVSVLHPRQTMRSMATKKAAIKLSAETGGVSAEHDLALLNAREQLAQVSSAAPSLFAERDEDEWGDIEAARQRVEELESFNDSLKGAWILSRHVHRVRVVQSMAHVPERSDFTVQDVECNGQQFQWKRWLGNLFLWYTRSFNAQYAGDAHLGAFDINDVALLTERVFVASGPWQAVLIDARDVWMWEDPYRTSRWLLLYLTLWHLEQIATYVYGYVIFAVIRHRYVPESAASAKATVERAYGRKEKAQVWSELVQQHGEQGWIEPLLDELGPFIQTTLGDFADLLEILVNFYRWEVPSRTWSTLFLFAACFLVSAFGNARVVMKLIWLVVGLVFFFSWPIKTRYPQYRQLVPSARWLYWGIPTHAELAIIRIQEKTVLRDAEALERNHQVIEEDGTGSPESEGKSHDDAWADTRSSPTGGAPDDIQGDAFKNNRVSFRAVRDKTHGRLLIHRLGIWYHDRKYKQFVAYSELLEMRKVDVDSTTQRWRSLQVLPVGLEILHRRQPEEAVQNLDVMVSEADRDRIFNIVLSWSNLKWQVLHLDRQHGASHNRSNLDRTLKRAFA